MRIVMCQYGLGRQRRLRTAQGGNGSPEGSRGGQATPKGLVWWWERRGDREGVSAARAQCSGDVSGYLLRIADITGLEKSKCLPFIWKGEKEKPGDYGSASGKNIGTHQKRSCGSLGGSGVTGTSPLTSARSNQGKTPAVPRAGPSLGSLWAQDGVQPRQHLPWADRAVRLLGVTGFVWQSLHLAAAGGFGAPGTEAGKCCCRQRGGASCRDLGFALLLGGWSWFSCICLGAQGSWCRSGWAAHGGSTGRSPARNGVSCPASCSGKGRPRGSRSPACSHPSMAVPKSWLRQLSSPSPTTCGWIWSRHQALHKLLW